MKKICFVFLLGVSQLAFSNTISPTNATKGDLISRTIEWQGLEREYLLYLPPVQFMLESLPVVVNLHGGGGTAKGAYRLTNGRFNDLAKEQGFIVVYPNAIDKSWNDGREQILKPENKNVDDVGFIAAIIQELKEIYDVDLSRIFATGMSNGGFMTSRLLCDRADLFRGGAVVTASISTDYFPKCKPTASVAVLVMNGTDDPLVPYNGGQIKVFKKTRGEILSTDQYLDFWKNQNNCNQDPIITQLPDSNSKDKSTVSVVSYTCDKQNPVVLYKIKGGGHTWPGGRQYLGKRLIGVTNRDINACDVIWKFFSSLN